jgi:hypothetical protein
LARKKVVRTSGIREKGGHRGTLLHSICLRFIKKVFFCYNLSRTFFGADVVVVVVDVVAKNKRDRKKGKMKNWNQFAKVFCRRFEARQKSYIH